MGDAVGCAIVEAVCQDELTSEAIPNGGPASDDVEQNLYPLIENEPEARKGDVNIVMGSTI